MAQRKKPTDVFTPRAPVVNNEMYVKRNAIEKRLNQVIGSNKFVVIHGESGNGKTWLYKKVLAERNVYFEVVNLAAYISCGSMESVFDQKLGQMGYAKKVSSEGTVKAGAKPFGIGVEGNIKTLSNHNNSSSFTALVSEIRNKSGGRACALILDNFESIISDSSALNQIRALIISADDQSFAEHTVQVFIVGVPGNLKETIAKGGSAGPVSNRLTEIPEVERLSKDEAKELIQRGFVSELGLSFEPSIKEEELYDDICWYSDRIAQHIHEICLIMAQNSEANGFVLSKENTQESLQTWANDTLSGDLAVIEGVMNARDTKAGRKNQVLYSMGISPYEDMKYSDVENIVKEQFDVGNSTLNVSQILSGFAKAANPLIRRTPKGDAWRFVSPKFKMAIRSHLVKTDDGKVALKIKG